MGKSGTIQIHAHRPVRIYEEVFQLRVVPEPASVMLLVLGTACVFLGVRRHRQALPVVLVVLACLMTTHEADAYPSRSGDCAVCHSNPGPREKTGDFEIKDTEGSTTDSFTVAAGESTEIVLEFTKLLEDHLAPGTLRRGYMTVQGLDLLNVDKSPPAAVEDIPYAEALYAANVGEEAGQWHEGRFVSGAHRYMGPTGQIFAQSSTDPNALMPFPLSLSPDVPPGDYFVTAILAGGRPTDEDYHDGWFVEKQFTLTVTPAAANAAAAVPEPASLMLLGGALLILGLWSQHGRRRRRP